MKKGDLVTIYGNPIKEKYPESCKAKLIKLIADYGILQQWTVAYEDDPNMQYDVLIKKQ